MSSNVQKVVEEELDEDDIPIGQLVGMASSGAPPPLKKRKSDVNVCPEIKEASEPKMKFQFSSVKTAEPNRAKEVSVTQSSNVKSAFKLPAAASVSEPAKQKKNVEKKTKKQGRVFPKLRLLMMTSLRKCFRFLTKQPSPTLMKILNHSVTISA